MIAMVAAQSAKLWQPDKFAVASFSVLVTGVVLAALVFMFARQPETLGRISPTELRLISSTTPEQAASKPMTVPEHQIKPQAVLKPVPIMKVENIPLNKIEPPSPPLVDWQQQILMSVDSQSQNSANPNGLILIKPSQITPLRQALSEPRKPEPMQNGQSYRSIYGDTIQKINGKCVELDTIQVGTSPYSQMTIAMFPAVTCPGDYKPSMIDELSNWADKEAQKHQPPL